MSTITRRNFFKAGLAATGSIAAAQVCGGITGEQPLGPFFPRPDTPVDVVREDQNPAVPIYLANDNDLTFIQGRAGKATGQVVYVKGKVTDEQCRPLSGATIVIWQASESGRYNHKGDGDNHDFTHPITGEIVKRKLDGSFQSWGRAVTDANGEYTFKTIVPGFYPADLSARWYRPPHIHFLISATGFPQLVTQMYFRGETIKDNAFIQELNAKDYILQAPQISPEQRDELVVEFKADQTVTDGLVGRFDITLKR